MPGKAIYTSFDLPLRVCRPPPNMSLKRLLRRLSVPNIRRAPSTQDPPPPVPTLGSGDKIPQNDALDGPNPASTAGVRPEMAIPALLVSPPSSSEASSSFAGATDQTQAPNDPGSKPLGAPSHNRPTTLNVTTAVKGAPSEPSMSDIWGRVNDPGDNRTQLKKAMDNIEDRVGEFDFSFFFVLRWPTESILHTAYSDAGSLSVQGFVSAAKAIAANELVQDVEKAALNSIPGLMKGLEAISEVHPFVKAAFLPFKFAYNQELKRHDNDRSRLDLFEAIKEVMILNIELKVVIDPNDRRQAPNGQPLPSRLSELGEQMKDDIKKCYNALDAMQKQSPVVRFLKASDWNGQLTDFKLTFKTRHKELQLALTLDTAVKVHDISAMIEGMRDQFMKEFQSLKTPQDRLIDAFFKANGGEEKVMQDETKCAELINLQKELSGAHDVHSEYAAGVSDNKRKMGPGGALQDPTKFKDKTQIDVIRKQYRTEVATVIQDNMRSFASLLDLSLNELEKEVESIKDEMHQDTARMLTYMKDGPHRRLKDRIMRQVWKDQGWRGNAKARTLVLVLRDYLVERVERSKPRDVDGRAPSPYLLNEEDPQDPETAMGVPLPDDWVVEYLHLKRLRNLQQVFDPDMSGFSTISEVNAFTRPESRPPDWSLPKWLAFWAVGWQIYATKYCTEIDNSFAQMLLICNNVGMRMPGNKRHINSYIKTTWPLVTGLTSGFQRFEGTTFLAGQFKDYFDTQENEFRSRLTMINFDIDSSDAVQAILGRGGQLEHSIFLLLAMIMRRHLAKMHLCQYEEISEEELYNDTYTIMLVVDAAWWKYKSLVDL
ncbi:hypothetical protein B0H11DRAFT_273180 [Mycena galericulata]|nr:hypothetical protein B0H11DRAFT_273180 [Mycena galericulata]